MNYGGGIIIVDKELSKYENVSIRMYGHVEITKYYIICSMLIY